MTHNSQKIVSVIMPAYQAAQTLEWSIRSVMQQTYTGWELILLVDAASDDTDKIAGRLADEDKRIRLFVSKRNRGVVRTRNIALRLAKGKYVAFLDADDYWIPEKLALQLTLLQKNNANFCYTSALYVRHDLNWKSTPARMPATLNLRRLLKGNPVGMSTVLMDVENVGKFYFETLPAPYVHEDYAYWVRLFGEREIKAVFLKEPTTEVSIHHQTRSGNKLLAMKSQYFILRTIAGAGRLKAFFYILSYVLLALHKRGIRSWMRQLFR